MEGINIFSSMWAKLIETFVNLALSENFQSVSDIEALTWRQHDSAKELFFSTVTWKNAGRQAV